MPLLNLSLLCRYSGLSYQRILTLLTKTENFVCFCKNWLFCVRSKNRPCVGNDQNKVFGVPFSKWYCGVTIVNTGNFFLRNYMQLLVPQILIIDFTYTGKCTTRDIFLLKLMAINCSFSNNKIVNVQYFREIFYSKIILIKYTCPTVWLWMPVFWVWLPLICLGK